MVGVDIVLISRVYKILNKGRFYNRILNEIEQEYISTKKSANKVVEADSVAGFFAAKEAILKAFGVGITNGYGFKDITIDHDEFGAPVVILSEKLNKLLKEKNKSKVNVSISHDEDYAIAMAVFE